MSVHLENCPCCNSDRVGYVRGVSQSDGKVSCRVYCKSCQLRTGPEDSKANAISIWQMRKYNYK